MLTKASKPKQRKCKAPGCTNKHTNTGFIVWCSPGCGAIIGLAKLQKHRKNQELTARVKERQEIKARKAKLYGVKELKPLAQKATNAWVRYRDKDMPCICCDRPMPSDNGRGGSIDAGHHRARSLAPWLAYNEDNIFAQRKECNAGANRATEMVPRIIARIGQERYEAIRDSICPPGYKLTREFLLGVIDHYTAKLKEAKK